MNQQRPTYQPGWAPVHYGEDEPVHRRRQLFTWQRIMGGGIVLVIAIYAGLLLSLVITGR